VLAVHTDLPRRARTDRIAAMLESVRLSDAQHLMRAYPHEVSGGQRQRIMIAAALVLDPSLLIADEPTTALDVTVQAEILDLIRDLSAAQGTAVLMISHDLGLIANMCARVGVMYAGRLVEQRPAQEVFRTPSHPYTKGLVASLPLLGARARHGRHKLKEITGVVPAVTAFPDGCRFNPRCYARTEICVAQDPGETPLPHDGLVRCHHHE